MISSKCSKNSETKTLEIQDTRKSFPHLRKPKEIKFGLAKNMQEKAHFHVYSGVGPRTVKFFWEQHDTTDIDVAPEAFEHISRDATYKLWDLVHTLKTYAKHSGGRITYSLVNEVLKDIDTSVILGSNDRIFNKTEYDGSFYFSIEESVDLRLTYFQQLRAPTYPLATMETSWSIEGRNSQVLFEFATILFAGIFLADYKTYKRTLHSAALSSKLGAVLKIIFKKCAKILVSDQTPKMVHRCMEFLRIVFFNSRFCGVEFFENTSYLSKICKSLTTLPLDWRYRVEHIAIKRKKIKLDKNDDSSEENMSSKRAKTLANIDQDKQLPCNGLSQLYYNAKLILCRNEFFSDYTENIYSTLGILSNNCLLFQNDYTLMLEQIDNAVKKRNSSNNNDEEIFASIFKAICTLGENAFLKLIPHLSELGSFTISDTFSSNFCIGGKMLKEDNLFMISKWLQDTAGDKLFPFLVDVYKSPICSSKYKTREIVVRKLVDKKTKFNVFSEHEKSIDVLITSLKIFPRMKEFKYFDLYSFESKAALSKLRKLHLPSLLNSVKVNNFQHKAMRKKSKVLKPLSYRFAQYSYPCMIF